VPQNLKYFENRGILEWFLTIFSEFGRITYLEKYLQIYIIESMVLRKRLTTWKSVGEELIDVKWRFINGKT